ncbi:MAG: SDR family oxidoreductase [Paludibacter sp.]|nr:SDR family oxidoreductase [Paludibacter sp.]
MSKLALITGGTKGIGLAVAEILAARGYDLLLVYAADRQRADEVVAEITRKNNVKVAALQADISDKRAVDVISDYLIDKSLMLNALVFNAGLTLRTGFETTTVEDWEKVFFANVHFPVFLLQKTVKNFDENGSVVFTGSMAGIHPHGTSLAYGVTKSAIHALVTNLVKFLEPYKIRVNGVAPGFVETEWQTGKPVEIRKNIENKIALHRFCHPSEVAAVYQMLIENCYINGEVVVVDGGYSYK